ncbi:MAG: hypothetical protein NTY35_09795 [Planctomycetota bacterium]|nr:hypothetical protein [Planctomycetota bacterium]
MPRNLSTLRASSILVAALIGATALFYLLTQRTSLDPVSSVDIPAVTNPGSHPDPDSEASLARPDPIALDEEQRAAVSDASGKDASALVSVPFEVTYANRPSEVLAEKWNSLSEERNKLAAVVLEARIAQGAYEIQVVPRGQPFQHPQLPKYWSMTIVQEDNMDGTLTMKVAQLDPRSDPKVSMLLDEQLWLEGELTARGDVELLR